MRRWPDGGTYSGQFASGELHGEGMYISAQGDQYEGQYKSNVREGEGRLTASNGDRYEGEFARHRMNGNGAMHYADGGVYKGEWSASMRCGNGHMVWSGGDEFEGKWEDDMACGEGLFSHPAGYERDGEWEKSEPSTVARRAEFFAWAPPPTELTFEGAVIALESPPPPEGEGEGGDAAADGGEAAEPPLSSLTLRLTVVGAPHDETDGASPISASTGLVGPLPNYGGEGGGGEPMGDGMGGVEGGVAGAGGALDPTTTCEGAGKLELSMAEGVARPIQILCELCDPAGGGEPLASAEVALPLSATGETKGTLEALPLGRVGADADAPPYARLTITYSAVENYHEVEEGSRVEPSTEEALAELLAEPLTAGTLIPPVSAVLCRTLEIEPPPADEDADPPAAAPAKGKGKDPEPEPEPEGPIIELYPVAGESGRAITVTLVLPEEAVEARLEAHTQAVAEGQAAYEAELAAYEEAMAARAGAEEANAEPPPEGAEPPPEPPEPYARPPEPKNEWVLGTLLSKHGRLLVRGLAVPPDVPTGPATLLARETTPPLALFDLPHVEEVRIPVTLLAEGDDAIPEPPPPTKGKK